MWQSSASESAIVEAQSVPTRIPYTTPTGPPEPRARFIDAHAAVHEFRIANDRPMRDSVEKCFLGARGFGGELFRVRTGGDG